MARPFGLTLAIGHRLHFQARSKQFFFEKKNQKTFAYKARHHASSFLLSADRLNTIKSFLFLFFKKEILSSSWNAVR
jgi:hypothetical protein